MERLSPKDIERLKAEGAQKREERRLKREALARKVFIESLSERVEKAFRFLERSFVLEIELTPEQIEEVKALFNLDSSVRLEAYLKYSYFYEQMVFLAWQKKGVSDEAYRFFDEILSFEEAGFSGNSAINLLGGVIDEKTLNIFEKHREKFVDSSLASVMKLIVERRLERGHCTKEEKPFLEKIAVIFENVTKAWD